MGSAGLQNQLDFIFFFYGLGFLLLAVTVRGMGKTGASRVPWPLLGRFALVHGVAEWLDLAAIGVGDAPVFQWVRAGVMLLSFVLLFEFGRLGLQAQGVPMPGRWTWALVGVPVVEAVWLQDATALNVLSRYSFGLFGAWLAAALFLRASRLQRQGRVSLRAAAVLMGAYGVCTGLVVPAWSQFPATEINHAQFLSTFGFPVQLVRGVLACGLATVIWIYHRECCRVTERQDNQAWRWRLSALVLVSGLAVILLGGGWLTNQLGEFGLMQDDLHARARANNMAKALSVRLETAERLSVALSGSSCFRGFAQPEKRNQPLIDSNLDRYSQILTHTICFVMNASGMTVAASNRAEPLSFVGKNYAHRPYFTEAMKGQPIRYFAVGVTTHEPAYFFSRPLFDDAGRVVGVVVVRLALEAETIKDGLISAQNSYLTDVAGVILVTRDKRQFLSPLWSVTADYRLHCLNSGRYPFIGKNPLVKASLTDGCRAAMSGTTWWCVMVPNSFGDLQVTQLVPLTGMERARMLGIATTLVFTLLVLGFFMAYQRVADARQALMQSEQELQHVFDHVYDAIIVHDGDGRIQAVNERMLELVGISRLEAMRQSFRSGLSAAGCPVEQLPQYWCKALAGEKQLFEWRLRRPADGSVVEVEIALCRMEHFGSAAIVATIRDITSRKLVERQLLRAQKQESIGRLAAGLAHEINTPLQFIRDNLTFVKDANEKMTAVRASFRGMREALEAVPDSRVKDLVAAVKQAEAEVDVDYLADEIPAALAQSLEGVQRVSIMTRALKDMTQAGTQERVFVNMNQVLSTVMTVTEAEWRSVATMETELCAELPLVPGNSGELHQVVLELLTNAAHAIQAKVGVGGGGKGVIRIITRMADAETLEISVTDTGTGISVENQTFLFNPLTSGSVPQRRGQGLELAHAVVQNHGGTLTYSTEPGQGTTFVVRLPVKLDDTRAPS